MISNADIHDPKGFWNTVYKGGLVRFLAPNAWESGPDVLLSHFPQSKPLEMQTASVNPNLRDPGETLPNL